LIGEYDINNNLKQETVYLGNIPVAVVKLDAITGLPVIYYVQADHLNTPRVILNTANTPVWRWDNSDAFGIGQPNQDPDGDGKLFEYNLRFPGQYYDRETGLHYNHQRYYDPQTGRYISYDPIGLAGGINPYTYVRNNPLRYTDPRGLTPQGAAYGAAFFGGTAALLSVAADVGSLGVNIPATPAEIAAAAAAGAVVGDVVSDFANNIYNAVTSTSNPLLISKLLQLNVTKPLGEVQQQWLQQEVA
jgi:RHS repeat-associated protein